MENLRLESLKLAHQILGGNQISPIFELSDKILSYLSQSKSNRQRIEESYFRVKSSLQSPDVIVFEGDSIFYIKYGQKFDIDAVCINHPTNSSLDSFILILFA